MLDLGVRWGRVVSVSVAMPGHVTRKLLLATANMYLSGSGKLDFLVRESACIVTLTIM
jgi:hypothetical protein